MKKTTLLFYFTLFILHFTFSQTPLVKQWDKRFGGTDNDELSCLQQTADGGYILGGSSKSAMGGDKSQICRGYWDYWIVKIDWVGNKQWDKTFGGSNYDYLHSIKQTTDGGYILGGFSISEFSGDKTQSCRGSYDYWIVKIDSLGNKQWDKTFGGSNIDWLFSVQQTSDGGYMLGGYSLSGIGGDKTEASRGSYDYWIVKTDSLGNKQWDKTYGGTDTDLLFALQQTTDGGYILGGYSSSGIGGDKTQAGQGIGDYWIIKTDSLGSKQWDKSFGGIGEDELYSIQQTTDGGYILGGHSDSGIGGDKTEACRGVSDYWIVKTDSSGNKLWDKTFGGVKNDGDFGNVSQTADGGHLISGTSYSNISGDKTENNLGPEQTWIVKVDSLGKKLWDKTILTTGQDEAGYSLQVSGGCYVFANFTNGGTGGYKTQPNQDTTGNTFDYWIVKFCENTASFLPVCSFNSSDSVFCNEPGKCISFFDHSTNNPTGWQWLFPNATPNFSNLQNPANICYNTPGTYPVTLIVSNTAGHDTLTVSSMITVGGTPPDPIVSMLGPDTLVCSHAAAYQWFFNGNIINGATDSFYVAAQLGSYAVRITDSGGCSRLSDGIAVGITTITSPKKITVYPNPAGDVLLIDGIGRETVITIYNTLGEALFCPILWRGVGDEAINTKNLSAGIYFIWTVDDQRCFVTKFVKE